MSAPTHSCGDYGQCVWRVATRTDRDRFEFCIAVDNAGEPCVRKATVHIGRPTMDNLGDDFDYLDKHPGQPFCNDHAKDILAHLAAAGPVDPTVYVTPGRIKLKKRHADQPDGFVYFARRGEIVKIGTTRHLGRRLTELTNAAGMPFDEVVAVPGSYTLESTYHQRFDGLRQLGEWFHATASILDEMDRLRPHSVPVELEP